MEAPFSITLRRNYHETIRFFPGLGYFILGTALFMLIEQAYLFGTISGTMHSWALWIIGGATIGYGLFRTETRAGKRALLFGMGYCYLGIMLFYFVYGVATGTVDPLGAAFAIGVAFAIAGICKATLSIIRSILFMLPKKDLLPR